MKNFAKLKNYLPIVIVILVGSIYFICYSNVIMVELPHLTWFDQMSLVEKYFEGNVQMSDLLAKYGEHGLLANNLLWLINIAIFSGTTLFDVYLNDINVIICGTIIAIGTWKSLDISTWKKIIILFSEALFMFGSMQGSSGAMETQVRLGIMAFMVTMVYLNKLLIEEDIAWKECIIAILLIVLSINFFGTLYSFAGVPMVWFAVLFRTIIKKKTTIKHCLICVTYFLTIPLYLIEYDVWNIIFSGGEVSAKESGNIFTGLLSWCANGTFGWAYVQSADYNPGFYLIIGFISLMFMVGASLLFFITKMYEKTWIPIMGIAYSIGVYVMIFIGRSAEWEWFTSEWYNVHIKLAFAGTLWIFAYALSQNKRIAIISWLCIVFFSATGIIGNGYTLDRAPAVHNYYQAKQQYLFISDKDEMPVDDNGQTPLLHSLDMTMYTIEILEKYKLSVYKDADTYVEYILSQSNEDLQFIQGHYEDGWVEQTTSFVARTDGCDSIRIYYIAMVEQAVTVTVNEEETYTFTLLPENGQEVMQSFEFSCGAEEITTVQIESNYASKLSGADERIASFLIHDVVIK